MKNIAAKLLAEIGCAFSKVSVRSQVVEEKLKLTIFDALFGCWHKRTTFPLTSRRGQRRSEAASQTGTYVVCLDCGREFAYDWKKMRVTASTREEIYPPTRVEAEAR